jgi:predicted molibdopterin-dependent oxidoreductase YjgC
LARVLKVNLKPGPLDKKLKEIEINDSHPFLNHYPNRCVLCGKCEYICRESNERQPLSLIKRGLDTMISLNWEEDLKAVRCARCFACVDICPVGAITAKNQTLIKGGAI